MSRSRFASPLLVAAIAAACVDSTRPTTPDAVDVPSAGLAKNAPTNPTVTVYVANDAAYLVGGDGAFTETSPSPLAGMTRYKDAECGVGGQVWALPGGSGDMVLNTAAAKAKCTAYPRSVRLAVAPIGPNGNTTSAGTARVWFVNLGQLQKAANANNPNPIYIPIGDTQSRNLQFNDDRPGIAGRCEFVWFRPVLIDGSTNGSDQVQVRRDSGDTWTVFTLPDEIDPNTGNTIHHDKAYCRRTGELLHMPLRMVVVTSRVMTP